MSLGNKITIQTQEQLDVFIQNAKEDFSKNGYLEINIESGIRTIPQNRSLHLYFRTIAQALNNAGIDTTNFFKEGYSLPFSEHIVKDALWLPLMKALTNEVSTSKISKKQVTEIYEHLNRKLSEHGVVVAFPSMDNMRNNERVK